VCGGDEPRLSSGGTREVCRANHPAAGIVDGWIIVREVVNRWGEIKRLASSGKRPFGWVVESRRKALRRL
jgi:hypothetical protein